jgi:hypothetical protein
MHSVGSAGGVGGGGGSTGRGFTTADYSQLNTFVYELIENSSEMEDTAKAVLDNLLKVGGWVGGWLDGG